MPIAIIKPIIKWIVGGILCLYVLINYATHIPYVNKAIKSAVEKQLSNSLNKDVRIGSIKGSVFSVIKVNDISIFNSDEFDSEKMAEIESADVYFSLMDSFISRGIIKKIEIESIELTIYRNKNDKINILSVFKQAKHKPMVFGGEININNISGQFIDSVGFGKKKSEFKQSFYNGSLKIRRDNNNNVSIALTAKLNDSNAIVNVSGVYYVKLDVFNYEVAVNQLNVNKWGPYLIPFEKIKIKDDLLSLHGVISNDKKTINKRSDKIDYNIDVILTAASINVPKFRQPIKNSNGRIRIHNQNSKWEVEFELTGILGQSPINVSGGINLTDKLYGLTFESIGTIAYQDLSDSFLKNPMPYINFDPKMKIKISGKLTHPIIKTSLISDSFEFDGQNLGRIHINMRHKNKKLSIRSKQDSDIDIRGYISPKKEADFDVVLNNKVFPIINKKHPIRLTITGALLTPTVLLEVNDFDTYVLGYEVDRIQSILNINRQLFKIKDLIFYLKNGQRINYFGEYNADNKTLQIKQKELSATSNLDSQIIDELDSELTVQSLNRFPIFRGKLNIAGKGAFIKGLNFDRYQFDMKIDGNNLTIDTKTLLIGEQQLQGGVTIRGKKLLNAQIKGKNIDISMLKNFMPDLEFYTLKGRLNGDFVYDENKLNGKFKIENFSNIYGKFGDIMLDFNYGDKKLDIKSLLLRNFHYANLSGVVNSIDDFEIAIVDESMFRLEGVTYFNKIKLKGDLKMQGRLEQKRRALFYNGTVFSENLMFDENKFQSVFADFMVSSDKVHIRRSELIFGNGRMAVQGKLRNWGKQNSKQLRYDLNIEFSTFSLEQFFKVYYSYKQFEDEQNKGDVGPIYLNLENIYSKYMKNNLDIYKNQIGQKLKANDNQLGISSGKLDGKIKIKSSDFLIDNVDIRLSNFVNNALKLEFFGIKSKKINKKTNQYSYNVKNLQYANKIVEQIDGDVTYAISNQYLHFENTNVKYREREMENVLVGQYNIDQKKVNMDIFMKKNNLDLLSLLFIRVDSIQNDGNVHLNLEGPLTQLVLSSKEVLLTNCSIGFKPETSILNSKFKVKNYSGSISNGQILIKDLDVNWRGIDTFRRVTRAKKTNKFRVNGNLMVAPMDVLVAKQVTMNYNLILNPTFISVNFPLIYAGDIIVSKFSFIGQQVYPFNKKGKNMVLSSLGTIDETGPLATTSLEFRDGVFNFPKTTKIKKRARIFLNTNVILGQGTFIQGSIFGEGLYTLANHVSLEVSPVMSKRPFKVAGSLNSMDITSTVEFFDGSITIFDGVYYLLNNNAQLHYYRDNPQYISNQTVAFSSVIKDDRRKLLVNFNLKALRINDNRLSTENVINEEYPYEGIGLIVGSNINDSVVKITVLDYGLKSNASSYSDYELYGVYPVELSNEKSITGTSYLGLRLIMPSVVTNKEDTTYVKFGQQQINNFMRQSIRPYERRLAKRIGLYDLRIDYNFGKTILKSNVSEDQTNDLLGVTVVSDLYKEQLFLNLRTDVNLGSDEQAHQEDIKLTQVEIKYLISRNLNVGLKNINEYSEVTKFDPRFFLGYGYSF